MGDTLTVIIASFGDKRWLDLAQERAIPSLDGWDNTFVYHLGSYDLSVGRVRNMAVRASQARGWLLFLDPDDQLAPGYIDVMLEATKRGSWTDLYAPALQLIRNGRPYEPQVLDDRDIINGLNPCPIGTVIHRDLFDRVGGFWPRRNITSGRNCFEHWKMAPCHSSLLLG